LKIPRFARNDNSPFCGQESKRTGGKAAGSLTLPAFFKTTVIPNAAKRNEESNKNHWAAKGALAPARL